MFALRQPEARRSKTLTVVGFCVLLSTIPLFGCARENPLPPTPLPTPSSQDMWQTTPFYEASGSKSSRVMYVYLDICKLQTRVKLREEVKLIEIVVEVLYVTPRPNPEGRPGCRTQQPVNLGEALAERTVVDGSRQGEVTVNLTTP